MWNIRSKSEDTARIKLYQISVVGHGISFVSSLHKLLNSGCKNFSKRRVIMSFDPTTLKYNEAGLIPAIAQDHATGEILMMAWMNAESLMKTLETGQVTYWSRSRQEFWAKGATSGHVQTLKEMRVDCDRDCLLMQVDQIGAACHTGRRSCFYTGIALDGETDLTPEG
jgi:phosphoribosyl-AMP cyclohydrolase